MHRNAQPAFPLTTDLPVLFPTYATASAVDGTSGRQVANFNTKHPHVTGGGRPAAPSGFMGAGNRAGSLDGDGSPLLGLLIAIALWGLIAAGVLLIVGGCTDTQRNGAADSLAATTSPLQSAHDALVGSATTRPSAIVTTVEAIAPVTTPYVELVGSALGVAGVVIGAAASWLRTKPQLTDLAQQVVDHKTAITEIVGDVKSFANPTVPWSHTTARVVADAAGFSAAAPTPALADVTVTPAAAEVKPVTSAQTS